MARYCVAELSAVTPIFLPFSARTEVGKGGRQIEAGTRHEHAELPGLPGDQLQRLSLAGQAP